ncbi:MAG: hypothetical protein H5T49_04075 [Hadesarchaea archaeon]|nr:hypothetical protein [Hadesarchaea archaeon]
MKRDCAHCVHFVPQYKAAKYTDSAQGVCFEGGFSEIGDPHRTLAEEDCNAFSQRKGRKSNADIDDLLDFHRRRLP